MKNLFVRVLVWILFVSSMSWVAWWNEDLSIQEESDLQKLEMMLEDLAVSLEDPDIENIYGIDTYVEPYRTCTYTAGELQQVEDLASFLRMQWSTMIAQKLFSTASYETLVSAYIDEFIQSLESVVDFCKGESWYIWGPIDMNQMTTYLIDFVQDVLTLQGFEFRSVEREDGVIIGMDRLRGHFLSPEFMDMWSRNAKIQTDTTVDIDFTSKDTYTDTAFAFDLDVDQEGTMYGDTSQSNISVNGNFETKSSFDESYGIPDMQMDMSGKMDLDIRLVDGSLYIGMLDMDIAMEPMDPQMQQMMATANLFKWKYMEIPLWNTLEGSDDMLMWSLWSIQQMNSSVYDMIMSDRMMTYKIQNGIMYAWLNPAACISMVMLWSVSDCIQTATSLLKTPEDLIPVSYSNGVWTMSIWEWDESMTLVRDSRKVNSFEYIDGTNHAKYKNNFIDIDSKTQGWDDSITHFRASWPVSSQLIDVMWFYNDAESEAKFTLSWKASLDDIDLSLEIDMTDYSCEWCGMSMILDIKSSTQEVQSINVVAPPANDIRRRL